MPPCATLPPRRATRPPPEVVEYSCNLGPDLMGEMLENVSAGIDTYSMRQPLGVRYHLAASTNCT